MTIFLTSVLPEWAGWATLVIVLGYPAIVLVFAFFHFRGKWNKP